MSVWAKFLNLTLVTKKHSHFKSLLHFQKNVEEVIFVVIIIKKLRKPPPPKKQCNNRLIALQ